MGSPPPGEVRVAVWRRKRQVFRYSRQKQKVSSCWEAFHPEEVSWIKAWSGTKWRAFRTLASPGWLESSTYEGEYCKIRQKKKKRLRNDNGEPQCQAKEFRLDFVGTKYSLHVLSRGKTWHEVCFRKINLMDCTKALMGWGWRQEVCTGDFAVVQEPGSESALWR